MATATSKTLLTPEELLTLPDEKNFELINGELVERDMSQMTSWIGGEIHRRLSNHNHDARLGYVMPADCGYRCFPDDPDKIRRPDVSFITGKRLPQGRPYEEGYVPICPDLSVEVVSPNELFYEVEEKVQDFLRAGTPLVWVIIPPTRNIHIHRADGTIQVLGEKDDLSGEGVLPGFSCRVGDLFAFPAESADILHR